MLQGNKNETIQEASLQMPEAHLEPNQTSKIEISAKTAIILKLLTVSQGGWSKTFGSECTYGCHQVWT